MKGIPKIQYVFLFVLYNLNFNKEGFRTY
jgi:hypothetical protein